MSGVKGRSGTNKGKDKPFADALRMEIAAAGDDHKALRLIARNLIALASSPVYEAMSAIKEVADRLDGKPAQEATVTVQRPSPPEMSDDELTDTIASLRAEIAALGSNGKSTPAPFDPTQLH